MTIAWQTDPGGLFLELGHIAAAIYNVQGFRGEGNPASGTTWNSTGTAIRCLETSIDNIVAGYSAAQSQYIDGIRAISDAYIGAHDSFINGLVAKAKSTLVAHVQADNPQPLTDDTTIMKELIRQMVAASQTVDQCAVGATVAAGGSNVGNPTVICSVTSRYGKPLEYIFAETMVGTVLSDSLGNGSSTATAGQEPISIVGGVKLSNNFGVTWPDGSGANATVSIVDPEQDNAGGNKLTNSSFDTFTVTNQPDDWTVLVGTVGTHVLRSTTTYNSSAASLALAGSATLASLAQTFGTDTEGTLLPATVYGFNLQYYVDVVPAAGVFKVELVDSTNTVINDDFGTANAITSPALSGATLTTWTSLSGFFRTPTNLPSTVKLRIRVTTAVSTGTNLLIDYAALTPATQVYTAGPYVAAFRGSTDVVYGDRFTFAMTNDRAGLFQQFFEQVWSMSSLGLILPSEGTGSETIADSLVS